MTLALGVVNAVDMPTRQAFVPSLVGKDDLVDAIALNSTMLNGARVVGPAIAGLLVSALGEGCLVLFASSRSFWLSAAILVPTGFSMIVQMASSNTLVQTFVPDELRGRVMSVYSRMFLGMAPFGSLFSGFLAARIGAPATLAIGGGVCLATSALFAWHVPSLRAKAEI